MNELDLSKQINKAIKWSTITEILSKIVTPITNMVLARIITPEAFGVVAMITMIISFAEMIADAGFQKYIIQRTFKDKKETYENMEVAFWTNFIFSIVFLGLIIIFREQIANFVGNPNMGNVIAMACIQLPLLSLSSIPMALYKKNLEFKVLFLVRSVSIFIPLLITVPLAFLGLSYWAIIIGSILVQLSNSIILIIKSTWKPRFFFDIKILKKMFSFSIWSLFESISIWLTIWIDTLLISSVLDTYYLGLYKTSLNMVNSLMSIVTASITTVLFSALSQLQNEDSAFKLTFYKAQKMIAYIIIPLGVGLFLYSELATKIMLGSQWVEASKVIGVWSFTSALTIVYSNLNSEVYRSKGNPKLSFIQQIIHLCFLVPTCLVSLKFGFWPLVYSRAFIRIQAILLGFYFMRKFMGFSTLSILKNTVFPLFFSIGMAICAISLKLLSGATWWSFLSILICLMVYLSFMFVVARNDFYYFKNFIFKKGKI
ncbi:lipopolysaccharide biosynthesis protein [Paenibacillus sp. FSL R5-0914]|uniref:lipopolysaccharide biosynthesis protein n=1 Tax=Paenibacillus sp. FSL R5-0914 TaxID=2921665 RepID=UPI0030F4DB6D